MRSNLLGEKVRWEDNRGVVMGRGTIRAVFKKSGLEDVAFVVETESQHRIEVWDRPPNGSIIVEGGKR